ncbi:MAG: nucleoside-diphosphate kinase [Deltaproteobacteria bacterium]|nr:MAG: nucleoside-diphosphate kinase [Deltaproteobacteria bacterium]
MAIETTLSILKPDAVERNLVGKIIARFEEEGLRPVAIRRMHLSRADAEGFYAVHKERPFFGELVEFMTRSPVVVMALRGENAVARNREIMGATNPAEAAEGTLRKLYAKSIGENTVHGSDSAENAAIEVAYFFRTTEVNG